MVSPGVKPGSEASVLSASGLDVFDLGSNIYCKHGHLSAHLFNV